MGKRKTYKDDTINRYHNLQDLYEWYKRYLGNKILDMYIYENIPENFMVDVHEYNLVWTGKSPVINHDKYGVIALPVTDGANMTNTGAKNIFAQPIEAVITNPWDNMAEDTYSIYPAREYSNTITSKDTCVVFYNSFYDSRMSSRGLFGEGELLRKYAYMLALTDVATDITINNNMSTSATYCKNDATAQSINKMFDKIRNGDYEIAVSNPDIMDKVVSIFSNSPAITVRDLTEYKNFLLSSFYNEFGVRSNSQVFKKERLLAEETDDNSKLSVNVDAHLKARELGCEQVNEVFGCNMTVRRNESFIETLDEESNMLWSDEEEDTNGGGEDEVR